jgi:hypothetical protein
MPIDLNAVTKKAVTTKTPATLLKEAAAAAKTARLASDPQAKPHTHAINYRLDKTAKSPKGDYAKRYNALVELVGALNGKQWHYATSSWETTTHLSSQALLDHLTAPLDRDIDVLVVTPIARSVVFGDPKKLKG